MSGTACGAPCRPHLCFGCSSSSQPRRGPAAPKQALIYEAGLGVGGSLEPAARTGEGFNGAPACTPLHGPPSRGLLLAHPVLAVATLPVPLARLPGILLPFYAAWCRAVFLARRSCLLLRTQACVQRASVRPVLRHRTGRRVAGGACTTTAWCKVLVDGGRAAHAPRSRPFHGGWPRACKALGLERRVRDLKS